MRRFLFTAAIAGLFAAPSFADECNGKICSKADGNFESGWVVSIPAGTSDYFNVRYDPSDCDYDGDGDMSVCGLNIKVADFGAASPFPLVGLFETNFGLDPTGGTPDLGSAIDTRANDGDSLVGGLHIPFCVNFGTTHVITETAHVVVQFPPGDPGLLGISGDTDTNAKGGDESPGNPNPFDSSGFTVDGYFTPAASFTAGDFGMNLLIDPTAEGLPILKLNENDPDCGDYDVLTTRVGCPFGIKLCADVWVDAQGRIVPSSWLLFLSFLGAPIQKVGPVLPTIPVDKDGDGTPDYSSVQVGADWPANAGGLTVNFVAITGCPGVRGSVAISNEVTVHSLDDPPPVPWGVWDDGNFESGWVVQIPSQSCDYFSTLFDECPSPVTVTAMDLAVMDFGTSATAYPNSGFAPPNLGVDPSGLSPDLGSPYVDAPFPFPSFTFVTTSAQMVRNTYSSFTPAGDVIGFIRHAPGDPGLLGVGADSSSSPAGKAAWTLDCFSSPGNPFALNWGMRAITQ